MRTQNKYHYCRHIEENGEDMLELSSAIFDGIMGNC